ncbi:hypothetical protein Fmac_008948 [Flemingia macrophylla]|uniref:Uncharacterized protein n=1 Tax=Flemingia macrophylla TaxID=520843 RepID=A0ABD1MYW1_9FABA
MRNEAMVFQRRPDQTQPYARIPHSLIPTHQSLKLFIHTYSSFSFAPTTTPSLSSWPPQPMSVGPPLGLSSTLMLSKPGSGPTPTSPTPCFRYTPRPVTSTPLNAFSRKSSCALRLGKEVEGRQHCVLDNMQNLDGWRNKVRQDKNKDKHENKKRPVCNEKSKRQGIYGSGMKWCREGKGKRSDARARGGKRKEERKEYFPAEGEELRKETQDSDAMTSSAANNIPKHESKFS